MERKNFLVFGFGPLARFVVEQLIAQHNAFVVMVDREPVDRLLRVMSEVPAELFDFVRKNLVVALNPRGINLARCDHLSTPKETDEEHQEKRGHFFQWIKFVANQAGKFDAVCFLEESEQGLPWSKDEIDL